MCESKPNQTSDSKQKKFIKNLIYYWTTIHFLQRFPLSLSPLIGMHFKESLLLLPFGMTSIFLSNKLLEHNLHVR
jgi:hypothetical protein